MKYKYTFKNGVEAFITKNLNNYNLLLYYPEKHYYDTFIFDSLKKAKNFINKLNALL